jgi:thiamine-phosphate pyrophosphorylase
MPPQSAPALDRARLRGLYVITDAHMGGGHLSIARAALAGGAKILQLRDKTTPPRPLLQIALQLRALTRQSNALLLVNDHLDLALLCEADGVHLGPDDWPLSAVRRAVGNRLLLGASTGTPEEARLAQQEGADYIGIGAVFGTSTKSDAGDAIGLAGLSEVLTATTLPAAAIGGLDATNLLPTIRAGAQMACVVSAIAKAGYEAAMARATRELVALANSKNQA